jgi:sec-independent protein translocase protein TatA
MFTGLASPSHLIIVLVIILVLFGAKRILELAKGLGTGIKEFREGVSVSDESKPEASGIDERRGEGRADSEAGNKNARTDAAERSF